MIDLQTDYAAKNSVGELAIENSARIFFFISVNI